MTHPSKSTRQIPPQDRVVIVMGPTGAGKSTFIECATRERGQTVGHKLRSCTTAIRTVRIAYPDDGHPILLVDTPGFDDTVKSDIEVLTMIADFLVKTYRGNVKLASIIYLHKISDNRMTGSVLKNLRLLANLCGQRAMPNVILSTTMWSKVGQEEGSRREAQLKCDFWNVMIADGCRYERFENTYESAWRIIGNVSQRNSSETLLIQKEICDDGKSFNQTSAGIHARNAEKKTPSRGLLRWIFYIFC